ncbi:MAG: sugar ABC transporter permease [Nitriliruptoraceae bacterium]|nr:sugar ABC transporter permease [Nitriliruptoraceae bacterium]
MSSTTSTAPVQPAADTHREAPGRRRPPRIPRTMWFALPALLFLLYFFAYPMGVLVDLSLREVGLGTAVRGERPFVGLDQYRDMFTDQTFWASIPRTFLFVSVTVALEIVVGFFIALLLSERARFSGIVRTLIFFAWLLPPVVVGAVFGGLLSGSRGGVLNHVLMTLGIIDQPVVWLINPTIGMIVLILLTAWSGTPFVVLILLAALRGVPLDLYEAAMIDGATATKKVRYITIPQIMPTVAILVLLQVIYVYKTFEVILVVTGGGPSRQTATLPFLAYLKAFGENDFGASAAYGVVGVVIATAISIPYLLSIRRKELE